MSAMDKKARFIESMVNGRLQNFCPLVDSGSIDINAIDKSGKTPLIAVCYLQLRRSVTLAMVRKLLQSGASIDRMDSHGRTVLHHAVSQRKSRIMELLLETAIAELSIQDTEGNTPLHLAVKEQDLTMICKLVTHMKTHQITSELSNNDGLTPLALACQKGRVDIARYLSTVAQHSPTRPDGVTHRTGKQWLETVLFVPYSIDPFDCSTQSLTQLRPKPIDYIEPDCKKNCIEYDWDTTTISGLDLLEGTARSTSARGSRDNSFVTPFRVDSQQQPVSSSLNNSNDLKRTQQSYTQMLPYFMKLKATSSGILPAAQPPAEEERSLSELDGLELCDISEFGTCRPSDPLSLSLSFSRPRKFPFKERMTKQKVGTIQEVVSASTTWSKAPMKKRKSINQFKHIAVL